MCISSFTMCIYITSKLIIPLFLPSFFLLLFMMLQKVLVVPKHPCLCNAFECALHLIRRTTQVQCLLAQWQRFLKHRIKHPFPKQSHTMIFFSITASQRYNNQIFLSIVENVPSTCWFQLLVLKVIQHSLHFLAEQIKCVVSINNLSGCLIHF